MNPAPHVRGDSILTTDAELNVEEVLLREPVGITSVLVKIDTANSEYAKQVRLWLSTGWRVDSTYTGLANIYMSAVWKQRTSFRHGTLLWSAIANQSSESCEKIEESLEPETRTTETVS